MKKRTSYSPGRLRRLLRRVCGGLRPPEVARHGRLPEVLRGGRRRDARRVGEVRKARETQGRPEEGPPGRLHGRFGHVPPSASRFAHQLRRRPHGVRRGDREARKGHRRGEGPFGRARRSLQGGAPQDLLQEDIAHGAFLPHGGSLFGRLDERAGRRSPRTPTVRPSCASWKRSRRPRTRNRASATGISSRCSGA